MADKTANSALFANELLTQLRERRSSFEQPVELFHGFVRQLKAIDLDGNGVIEGELETKLLAREILEPAEQEEQSKICDKVASLETKPNTEPLIRAMTEVAALNPAASLRGAAFRCAELNHLKC